MAYLQYKFLKVCHSEKVVEHYRLSSHHQVNGGEAAFALHATATVQLDNKSLTDMADFLQVHAVATAEQMGS